MNKTKVLVLTRFGQWNNFEILPGRVEAANWDDNYPDEDNPIPIVKCGFSENSKKAFLEPIDLKDLSNEEGVFLVYDSMDENSFNILEQQCRDDEIYVLAHTSGTWLPNSFDNWRKKPFVLPPGKHTNKKEDKYYPLFDILTDDKGDKMNRIIDTIFKPYNKLENVLQFLHGCIVPDNDDDSFVSAYKKLLDDNNIKDDVEDFYVNLYSKHHKSDNDYQEALSRLRDTLLDYALSKDQP